MTGYINILIFILLLLTLFKVGKSIIKFVIFCSIIVFIIYNLISFGVINV